MKLELRVSKGTSLAVGFASAEELAPEEAVRRAEESAFGAFNVDLRPGDELETYTITAADAAFNTSYPLSSIRHVVLRLIDAEGADVEIASMRLVTLKEHLASIPPGIGWHGLDDVFRETIVSRSPERVTFDLDLPSEPWLELAVGTVDNGPVTFRVEAASGGGAPTELLRRTVSTPGRWQSVPVELGELAGRRVALSLVVEAEADGTPGFWGTPVVRNRAGEPATGPPTPARRAVAGDRPPRGG